MKTARALALAAVLALPLSVAAAEEAGFAVAKSDTVGTVLEAQKGKRVTVRLVGGDELTGKVVSVSEELLHLGELSGKDFFDAAVKVSTITAVVVKAR